MTSVRDASFDVFRAHGMTTMFGNPGSTELPMLQDYPDDFTLRPRAPGGGRRRDGRRLRAGERRPGAGQPAHRARRRQRDGRDLQRPGQPLAAGDHRRPAGPRADRACRRTSPTATRPGCRTRWSSGATSRRGPRTCRWRSPGRRTWRRCRRRGRRSSRSRWTTGTPRSTTPTSRAAIKRKTDGPRRRRPGGGRRARPPARAGAEPGAGRRARHRRQRRLGRRGRARRAPAPAGVRDPARPAAGGSASPRAIRTSAGVLPPAIGPVSETLAGHDLILVVGSSVFPYYPNIPGPLLPEGAALVADHLRPRRGGAGADGRRDRRRRQAHARAAARRGRRVRPRPGRVAARADRRPRAGSDHGHRGDARAARGVSRGRDRRPRGAVLDPGAAQPAAALEARQLLLRRRRRARLRALGGGRACSSPSPTGRWSAWSARAPCSTR